MSKQKLIETLKATISELESEKIETVTRTAEKEAELQEEIKLSNENINSLEGQLKAANEKLRNKELTRFAQEFKELEDRYEEQRKIWFGYSIWATVGLLVAVVATSLGWLPHNSYYPEPPIVFLNAVLLTIFIYCLRQHSLSSDLRDDYGNRKALAQSYQYMVQKMEGEDYTDIEQEFFEEAAKIFTKRPRARGREVSLLDSILEKFSPAQKG
ncbi:MAG: hypothetical protein AAB573_02165 [Patescibacteria group bacterium]